ncbi:hypothetical protein [Helicobacter sp. UBA3407]|uniref:hypothetical protein n=1 Tax=Helicobacter sp. UBA3407 TaxID=1946588 RepID=UPI002614D1F7|nr:hypothetical protein [Helicobacter sp. UBA3407]
MQVIHKISKIFFILIFIFVFEGCLGKELPRITHYELSLEPEILSPYPTQFAGKKVRNPSFFVYLGSEASLKIANKRIAYKINENAIEYFVRNEWIEPLPLMIDSLVLKASKPLGYIPVKELKSGIPTLALNLLDFYYDEKQEIVVLNLIVNIKDSSQLLKKEVKVQKGDFYQIIVAMNQAVNSAILDSFNLLN